MGAEPDTQTASAAASEPVATAQARDLPPRALNAQALQLGGRNGVRRAFALQAAMGNRAATEFLGRASAPGRRVLARNPGPEPIQISADTFDGAAREFARVLGEGGWSGPARIIVANGNRVHVYDQTGTAVANGQFRFTRPVDLRAGVFVQQAGRHLHAVLRDEAGRYSVGGRARFDVDFSRDIDDRARFTEAGSGGYPFYVFPSATQRMASQPEQAPPEELPEFMRFEARNRANLPPWPAAVIPLTPQVATVNSTGSFVCRVEKNQGVNTLDRMTNLMEPTDFRWEVLKLEQDLSVTGRRTATRLQADHARELAIVRWPDALLSHVPGGIVRIDVPFPASRKKVGFDEGHEPHGWACAFRGAGHDRLVSRRWLPHGPWSLVEGAGDTSFVQFHSPTASPAEALQKARAGHERMGISDTGGYLQASPIATEDLAGLYDAGAASLKVIVHGRPVPERELLQACSLRHARRDDPREPIRRIAYVFMQEPEARRHLTELWLREIECWTIVDGEERRLDGEEPPPGS